MKIEPFIYFLLAAVGLAYVFPSPAHALPLDIWANAGISLIFFFYGVKLSPAGIRSGLRNYRLHLLIQACTFVVFPLIALLLHPIHAIREFWLGVFFLAVLPSTVSASVVMVNIAGGNLPAAIFNASISGLIGILITPLWMSLYLTSQAGDLSEIYLKLLYEIVVPLGLGLFCQKWLSGLVQRNRSILMRFDQFIILLVIYKSFVHSFESGIFSSLGVKDFLVLFLAVLFLFFSIYGLLFLVSSRWGFGREDQITALFCGTKKSLVHGTVFAKVFWGASSQAGIYLLPLMLFHALQILLIGTIASRYAQKKQS